MKQRMKKQISSEQTESNLHEVLRLLAEIPERMETLCRGLSEEQLRTSLSPGERTPTEVLAHILNCEALTSQAIYLALLIHEPMLPNIHAERDVGKLMRFEQYPFDELLIYFKTRRRILLRVLEPLKEKQWARIVREEKKARKESVYWQARGQALHELEHVSDLEIKLHRTS